MLDDFHTQSHIFVNKSKDVESTQKYVSFTENYNKHPSLNVSYTYISRIFGFKNSKING